MPYTAAEWPEYGNQKLPTAATDQCRDRRKESGGGTNRITGNFA